MAPFLTTRTGEKIYNVYRSSPASFPETFDDLTSSFLRGEAVSSFLNDPQSSQTCIIVLIKDGYLLLLTIPPQKDLFSFPWQCFTPPVGFSLKLATWSKSRRQSRTINAENSLVEVFRKRIHSLRFSLTDRGKKASAPPPRLMLVTASSHRRNRKTMKDPILRINGIMSEPVAMRRR